jgi:phospholipase C
VVATSGALAIAVLMVVGVALVPAIHGLAAPDVHRFPTAITHVVVIVFENKEGANVLSAGPFFHYLAAHYAYASSDYAICHPSAPNYLALTSGATYSQCGSDARQVLTTTNLADRVEGAKLTWGAFSGSMPSACDTTSSYPYAVKHNPFLFYDDVVNNASRCAAHDVSLTAWYQDVNRSTIPNFAFIVPNLLDDGHDTNVSYSDTWLRGFLSPLVNTTWFNHTAFLVTYDEGTSNFGAGTSHVGPTNASGGGHVYLSLVSPLSVGVGNLTNLTSHYSVVTTVEWLLGLHGTGHNDRASSWPPIRAAFA